ncbi:hypothetical protein B5S29_g3967 [[Candida] boidinii]|nr:hypothetical protein B5S29_g3967 [[Candida] boidinii]
MSFLNQRQEEELKKSVIQYLTPLLKSETINKENKNTSTLINDELLNQLTNKLLDVSYTDYEIKYKNTLPSNYLEKKWSTVLKLQRKIVDLENELASKSDIIKDLKKLNLSNDINSFSANNNNKDINRDSNGTDVKINWVPSKVKNVLKLYNSSITSIAIHPLKPIVASSSNDGMITIWNILDLSQPELIIRNAHTRTINSLAFTPYEISLSNLNNNNNNNNNNSSRNINNNNKNSNQILQDSKIYLASCSSDLYIKIWDIDNNNNSSSNSDPNMGTVPTTRTPVRTLVGHDHIISKIQFNPSNPLELVSCSRDKSIKIWDLTKNLCIKTFIGHSEWVRCIDIKNGYVLSCSNDHSVRLSHLSSGTGIGLMIGHKQVVETCKFIPMESNKYLDLLTNKLLNSFNNASDNTSGTSGDSFNANSIVNNQLYEKLGYKYAISGGRDDLIHIWLLPLPEFRPHRPPLPSLNPQGLLILTLNEHSSWVRNIDFHPNGEIFSTCSDDKSIKIWNFKKLSKLSKLSKNFEDGDNEKEKENLKLINDLSDFQSIDNLKSHNGFVNCIQFAPPVIGFHKLLEENVKDKDTNGNEQNSTSSSSSQSNDNMDEKMELLKKRKLLEQSIRCFFVSGSTDNTVKIWV